MVGVDASSPHCFDLDGNSLERKHLIGTKIRKVRSRGNVVSAQDFCTRTYNALAHSENACNNATCMDRIIPSKAGGRMFSHTASTLSFDKRRASEEFGKSVLVYLRTCVILSIHCAYSRPSCVFVNNGIFVCNHLGMFRLAVGKTAGAAVQDQLEMKLQLISCL